MCPNLWTIKTFNFQVSLLGGREQLKRGFCSLWLRLAAVANSSQGRNVPLKPLIRAVSNASRLFRTVSRTTTMKMFHAPHHRMAGDRMQVRTRQRPSQAIALTAQQHPHRLTRMVRTIDNQIPTTAFPAVGLCQARSCLDTELVTSISTTLYNKKPSLQMSTKAFILPGVQIELIYWRFSLNVNVFAFSPFRMVLFYTE